MGQQKFKIMFLTVLALICLYLAETGTWYKIESKVVHYDSDWNAESEDKSTVNFKFSEIKVEDYQDDGDSIDKDVEYEEYDEDDSEAMIAVMAEVQLLTTLSLVMVILLLLAGVLSSPRNFGSVATFVQLLALAFCGLSFFGGLVFIDQWPGALDDPDGDGDSIDGFFTSLDRDKSFLGTENNDGESSETTITWRPSTGWFLSFLVVPALGMICATSASRLRIAAAALSEAAAADHPGGAPGPPPSAGSTGPAPDALEGDPSQLIPPPPESETSTLRQLIAEPHRGLPAMAWFVLVVGLVMAAVVGRGLWPQTEPEELPGTGSLVVGNTYDVIVSEGQAYVADGESGLRVVNVSDRGAPRETASFDIPGGAVEVASAGGLVGVISGYGDLWVYNASEMNATARYYDTDANDLALAGGYAYLASGYNGLQILDLSNPESITHTSWYVLPGTAHGVVVEGKYAYVTISDSGLEGLYIVNVSDPTYPEKAGFHQTFRGAEAVSVADGHAYLIDSESNLVILSVADPTAIVEQGNLSFPDEIQALTVSGRYAYLAAGEYGLRVIDISDPETPVEVGWNDTPGYARGVAVDDECALVADGDGGLQVISLELDSDGDGYPLGTDAYPAQSQLHARWQGAVLVLGVTAGGVLFFNRRDKKTLRRRVGPEVERLAEKVKELDQAELPHDIDTRFLAPASKAARGRSRGSLHKAVKLVEKGIEAARLPEETAEALAAARAVVEEARQAKLFPRTEPLDQAAKLFAALEYDTAQVKAEAVRRATEATLQAYRQAREQLGALQERLAAAAESIDTSSLVALPRPVESFLEMGDPEAALEPLRSAATTLDRALDSWRPELTAEIPTELVAGRWIRDVITISNQGKAHARNVHATLEGVNCKQIPAIPELRSGESSEVEVAFYSDESGSLPWKLELRAERSHDGQTVATETSGWIEVLRAGALGAGGAEPTLPPTSRGATRARAQREPAPEWKPPAGLVGDDTVLADYFGLRWKAFRAWPGNEPLLDELHNRRDEFTISSYFEIPISPVDVLQSWALPPNLRNNVHLDVVRRDIVEAIGSADLERNFVIIGEPGVGKTVLLFEVLDRLLARGPAGIITTPALGDAHQRFGLRIFYDDIPENLELVEAIAARQTRGLVVTAREADWQNLPTKFQALFDRLTVPLFADDEMVSLCRTMLTFSGLGYEAPALELLVSYAGGSPIYVWSLIRELMHSGLRTLSRTYIQEHATKGMANYVAMLLQRLLKDGKEYRPGGLHALTCLLFLAEYMDERHCHDLYFRAVADAISDQTDERFSDGLHLMTFNHAMSYLAGEGAIVRFPHDTWVDVLSGAGTLNPFRAEIQTIAATFADSGLFEQLKREAVPEAWSTVAARYRRSPSRQKESFLALADTLLRNFRLSELRELEVDIDLMREVASAHSHLPLAAMLVSKLQAAQPTQVTRIINIQDSVISRSVIGDGGTADVSDSLVGRDRRV